MTKLPPARPVRPDGSRDPRIEDPTNLYLVHPAARLLLPAALRLGISANAVSFAGLGFGALAGLSYLGWSDWRLATLGLAFSFAWLVADGLDGMIARATASASPLGRILDGICDHAVFGCLYVAIAWSVGGLGAFLLGIAATGAHAVQASLYEGERARYHRRLRGDPHPEHFPALGNLLARAYDRVAHSLDRLAEPFDRLLAAAPDKAALTERYRSAAVPPLRLMSLLSANMRVILLFLVCLAGEPLLFWWIEIAAMTPVALAGIAWHRRAERLLIAKELSRME